MSLNLGEKWVSDITYIRVNDNWSYLTTIIDLADRKVVGWTLSEDITTENTIMKAWIAARKNRTINDGFIFHSDRGVQYASNKMTDLFYFNRKITQSTRAERKVFQDLSKRGFEVFLPVRKELRYWKNRQKKWIENVLFPSYIFVNTFEHKLFTITKLPNIAT